MDKDRIRLGIRSGLGIGLRLGLPWLGRVFFLPLSVRPLNRRKRIARHSAT